MAMTKEEKDRKYILYKYAEYVEKLQKGELFDENGNQIPCFGNSGLIKPILSLYNKERGCAKYRQMLSDHSLTKNQHLPDIIRKAADFM